MDEREQHVRQAAFTSPYFDYEVSAFYIGDSVPYFSVIALCQILEFRIFFRRRFWTV